MKINKRTLMFFVSALMMVFISVYGMTDTDKDVNVYIVKRGDTLWSIALRFNDNPWIWPKLWEQNKYITNPHLIYPGESISLLPASAIPLTAITAQGMTSTTMSAQAITPGAVQPFTEGVQTATGQEEEQPSIETATPYSSAFVTTKENTYMYPSIDSAGFITAHELISAGEIVASLNSEKHIFGQHDKVFVDIGSGSGVNVGDRFFIYKTDGKVYDPASDDSLGYKIKILGILKITKVDNANVSECDIVESFDVIRVHDKLLPYEEGTKTINITLAADPVQGYIAYGKTRSKIYGEGNIVYIDRGSNSGVRVGNTFVIYKDRKPVKDPATGKVLHLPKEVLGKLLVIDVQSDTATAIITKSVKEIEIGNKIIADTASNII
ncbi:MAG: LysM peptidoglycan-binding domain-containing protein [Deltaproteobacteria bacterium]|nr:LysM peptidoglycan-binding domain-containing protein [Deltaproteobacteria bacterium]MCL5792009.1 LysM peptidoglycan-binding domain-containing protein [Deltaproteobacteria bacterium]